MINFSNITLNALVKDLEVIFDMLGIFPSTVHRIPVRRNGTLKWFSTVCPSNSLDAPVTITVLVNGVATGLAVSYALGETGPKSVVLDVPVVDGDLISFHLDGSGVTGGSGSFGGMAEFSR